MTKQFRFGSNKQWKVLDENRLLLVLMEELAGNARVSFEGELSGMTLISIPGASHESDDKWGKVIVPLEPEMGDAIISAIGGAITKAIVHVQIEKDGSLQFGAYDNFHPECIYFGTAIKPGIIESLVDHKIIKAIH
jgi:hypothetical protein